MEGLERVTKDEVESDPDKFLDRVIESDKPIIITENGRDDLVAVNISLYNELAKGRR